MLIAERNCRIPMTIRSWRSMCPFSLWSLKETEKIVYHTHLTSPNQVWYIMFRLFCLHLLTFDNSQPSPASGHSLEEIYAAESQGTTGDVLLLLGIHPLAAQTRESPLSDIGVSRNRGTSKSSILIEFSIINHPFWGTTISGNTHI